MRSNSSRARPVTIKEVAARAGVSTATVSRVLAGLGGAGPLVRDRVLKMVRELDYHPNRSARHLRSGSRKVIGIIIPDLQNPFFTAVVRGAEAVVRGAGFTLLLANSDGLPEQEQTSLSALRAEGAAGFILIPSDARASAYEPMRALDLPLVAVDRAPIGLEVDLVKIANQEGAQAAVAHMIAAGHREIALLNGPKHLDVALERLAGYAAALQTAGIPVKQEWIVNGDFRQAGGLAAMKKLLALKPRPRAVFITNNLMTLGALQVIHEQGLQIPRDLAVVSFDDMPWALSLQPPLTAVAQPAEELGRAAARLLLERLEEPDRPVRQVILKTKLIIRSSCGFTG